MNEIPRLRLFFHAVAGLDRAPHGALRLDTAGGYRFAAGTNSVPLSLSEIGVAAAHHPLVLTGSEGPAVQAAMVGYRFAENLLAEVDGSRAAGSYVPGYLRACPFIFIRPDAASDTPVLEAETRSPLLSETKGEKLFDGSQPTALLKERMALADAYRRDLVATQAFGAALAGAGLLVPQDARFDFAGGESHRVTGFRAIDPARLSALPEETVLAWWRNGYLQACFAIIHSQHRWAGLLRRAEQRRTRAAAEADAGRNVRGAASQRASSRRGGRP